jgi:DNA polymerase III subunit delta'
MKFNEVIGNSALKQSLVNGIDACRISHAQMFSGLEGSGNLAIALAYAQYLLCQNRGEQDACGVCDNCKKMEKFIHPDVHFSFPFISTGKDNTSESYLEQWREFLSNTPYGGLQNWYEKLGADQKQGLINAAESERIIKRLNLKSYEGGYKILVMWMPELLNITAANKLLKLIEEPVPGTLLLFVSADASAVLPTILSRVQITRVHRPKQLELANYLQEKLGVSTLVSNQLSVLCEGNVQEAINQITLSDEENTNFAMLRDWLRICFQWDVHKVMEWVEMISSKGRETKKDFLFYSTQILRQCMLSRYLGRENIKLKDEELDFVIKFSPFFHENNSERIIAEFEKAIEHIERNAHSKTLFLDLSLKLKRLLRVKNVA